MNKELHTYYIWYNHKPKKKVKFSKNTVVATTLSEAAKLAVFRRGFKERIVYVASKTQWDSTPGDRLLFKYIVEYNPVATHIKSYAI